LASDSAVRDHDLLTRANRLALNGWGRTYPNPLVGAVVVRDGVVLGEGWHREHGGLHAEVEALRVAGDASRGATLYASLEPCAHQGKQPPCTAAIIGAGIARVVVGARDLNPEASGGIEQLRAAGIAVNLIDGSTQSANFRFRHRFAKSPRPYVAVKLAVSMDGMIADASGNSRWVSSEASRDWVHWLRAGFGAVAVGAHTAIADNARLTVRGPVTPRIAPTRVVFDRSGVLPVDHVAFNSIATVPLIVILGSAVAESRRAALVAAGAKVLVADTTDDALTQLAETGVDSMLVEGGGRFAGALLRDRLVDRIYQVQCPRWLGDGRPAWGGLGAIGIESSVRWRVVDVQRMGSGAESDVVIEMEP
jgi:diaminohydroxyphosphoribosylaminopyrimidine deaminase / 5-amino-6-(5-phosphoribosylamino)uracil reductase